EQNNQCTFACHSASWSPNGATIALSDGDSARVLLIAAGGGAGTPISPADERSRRPVYLPDGRIGYVTEHVSQDQSWTDRWTGLPSNAEPYLLAFGVLALLTVGVESVVRARRRRAKS